MKLYDSSRQKMEKNGIRKQRKNYKKIGKKRQKASLKAIDTNKIQQEEWKENQNF